MSDPLAIARFAEVVFGYLDGFVPVRLLPETGTPDKPIRQMFCETDDLADSLASSADRAASEGRAVFVVPCTVAAPGSARAADIRQSAVVLIDIDAGDIDAIRKYLETYLGPASLVVHSGGRTAKGQDKLHLYWRLTEAAQGDDLEQLRDLRQTIAEKAGGDPSFASLHQPIRVPGTIHGKNGVRTPVRILADTGREYDLVEFAEAAEAMPALVPQPRDRERPTAPTTGHRDKPGQQQLAQTYVRAGGVDGITRFDAISSAIGHWLRNARLGNCTVDEARQAVADYNMAMMRPPWPEDRLRKEFDALQRLDLKNHPAPDAAAKTAAGIDADPTPAANSEDALASTFAATCGPDWRHVRSWKTWLQWDGQKWTPDDLGAAQEEMRQVCRFASQAIDKPAEARRLSSEKTITASLRLAQSDPRISIAPNDLDTHAMLLNTPAGVIDLETGEVIPHDRGLLLSQCTTASPGDSCPRWTGFLDEVCDGDVEMVQYLARLVGYCLTGVTSEQVFAFFHGSGANGKSVFLQAVSHVLGQYSATAALDTFMASNQSRHLSELAGLRAARLVQVPETEAGRSWAEARIKAVTGGESIRANFMYRDHFEFKPQFKLIVAGNHRPNLNGVGEAMRRRLHVVPFNVTIPEGRRDRHLQEKLFAERDGILAWMLEGCVSWQRQGLNPPERVRQAAEEYVEAEDIVGHWIEECCDLGPNLRASARDLFSNWSAWCDATGHPAGTQKILGAALRERNLMAGKVKGARGWLGIAIRHHRDPQGEAA